MTNPILTPEQQTAYYGSQASSANPLSPLDWLAQQGTRPPAGVIPTTDPSIGDAYSSIGDYYKGVASTPIDENKIRSDVLDQFQKEIDAANAVYADQLSAAKTAGAGRLGSEIAIEGRRGLLGSTFGQASQNNVEAANTAEQKTIENNKLLAVTTIQDKAYQVAQDEINNKNAARANGVDSYLSYLTGADERKKSNAETAAKSILGQGMTPDSLGTTGLANLAKIYGVTTNDIYAAYNDAKPKATSGGGTKAGTVPQTYIDDITSVLNNTTPDANGYSIRDKNGYVDPNVYTEFFNAWLAEGYSSTDFFKEFPVRSFLSPDAANSPGIPALITQQLPKPASGTDFATDFGW